MSAALPSAPEVIAAADEADAAHIVCCNDDRAMCGEDVSGHDWVGNDVPECEPCATRFDAGLPCGAPLCGLRSWWRNRRSS